MKTEILGSTLMGPFSVLKLSKVAEHVGMPMFPE